MKKTKEMKKLQNDIAETEFAKELFFYKARDANSEERVLLNDVVYPLCYYLSYLYDKKEAMLEQQIKPYRHAEVIKKSMFNKGAKRMP